MRLVVARYYLLLSCYLLAHKLPIGIFKELTNLRSLESSTIFSFYTQYVQLKFLGLSLVASIVEN